MKIIPMTLTCLVLMSYGATEALSMVVSIPPAKLTAADLVGSYTGQGGGDATGTCYLTFKVERKGLFFTPYFVVQLNIETFSARVSDVNATLATQSSDNPDVVISERDYTGVLSDTEHDLELIFHGGRFDAVHYQTASFSGGWISGGPWHVVDCSDLQASGS